MTQLQKFLNKIYVIDLNPKPSWRNPIPYQPRPTSIQNWQTGFPKEDEKNSWGQKVSEFKTVKNLELTTIH